MADLTKTQPSNVQLLAEFPMYIGPTVGSFVGLTGAVSAAIIDEYLGDKIKAGPLTPSGLGGVALGVLSLWVENPDLSAMCAYGALGMSAPHAYDATRAAIQRSRNGAPPAPPPVK